MIAVANIPAHLPFLDVLAHRWLAIGDPSRSGAGIILLPTRRAARALGEAFLRATAGRVLLLPRIVAVGGLDETPLALSGSLDLPPAVEPMRRLAELSRLVLAAGAGLGLNATGVAPVAEQAWLLARSLADLMDEAERSETDLAERLPLLADTHAEHWQVTLRFLRIVTEAWPHWLAENQAMNPVARQAALLREQARIWQMQPAEGATWAAGFGSVSPSLAGLLSVIARQPRGMVVLAGLDRGPLPTLPESHPQHGLAALLEAIGADGADVVDWPHAAALGPPARRVHALQTALLPEQALGAWLDETDAAEISGLSRLSPVDQQEEAAAIALLLRAAIEIRGRRAALITPDRGLARRVVVELSRFGVMVDDSAGEALAATPPAVLLRLLARAVCDGLPPAALLSLLKHPFVHAGTTDAECRRLARMLELACLRGPAPKPGLGGLRQALARSADAAALSGFLDDLQRILQPLTDLCEARAPVPMARTLEALIGAAEALAGPERLWSQEDGNALAAHLTALLAHIAILPPQPASALAGLLDASLDGIAVRSRRALRGRDETAEHPRLFIWGLLEARLQSVDFAVLGGLVEGVWPRATDPGPWMSRPMRAQAGLPSPEAAIGEAARDFLLSACCAAEVVLSRPGRRDGAPAVPARWLVRLDAWLRGRGPTLSKRQAFSKRQALPEHPALSWLRLLDQPEGAARAVSPPAPAPPASLRPRRLSITEIETWMRDPYAIHARHVLRLRALAPLEEAADAADYGTIVHDAMHCFITEHGGAHGANWPADAALLLRASFLAALERADLRPGLAAWWRPRLLRIAQWVAETESVRRAAEAPVAIGTEISGSVVISGLPGGDFTLRGRADRIEKHADGGLCLLDYKTGTPPPAKSVQEGWSSQLVLEAAMARIGGFGPDYAGETGRLAYWSMTGGHQAGRVLEPVKPEALADLVAQCWTALSGLIGAYDDPAQPYLSQPRPGEAPRFSDYAELARVAEWSAAQEDGG